MNLVSKFLLGLAVGGHGAFLFYAAGDTSSATASALLFGLCVAAFYTYEINN